MSRSKCLVVISSLLVMIGAAALAAAQESRADMARQQQADQESAATEEAQRTRGGPSTDPREQAINDLLKEIDGDPENADLHYKIANVYQEAGYLHSSLEHFNETLRIDSGRSRAWVNRGVVLKDLNRHEEAIQSFEKALEIDPDDALAYVNIGDEYLLQKQYQKAVDSYRMALDKDEQSSAAYYSLAIAFAETGMYRDAARAWRTCAGLATATEGEGSDTAKRALENAKLMEDIVSDAEREIQERQEIRDQLKTKQEPQAEPEKKGD